MSDKRINFQALRIEYLSEPLDPSTVAADPFEQFAKWLSEAIALELGEPNAFTLTTMGLDGYPSARTMLLKDVTPDGFTFFTNYSSAKGKELAALPRASMLFFWQPVFRQIRIQGAVEKVSAEESEQYFRVRPRGAQLGAWTSPQSSTITDRAWLEQKLKDVEARFEGRDVERPPHWGGYRVKPRSFEFWQGRESRLHDRVRYVLQGEAWEWHRLAP